MEDQPMIVVNKVFKNFKLPHLKKNTIKSLFTSVFDNSGTRKSFEVQHALKDIDFSINAGEFFGIVGRNGSGKSTLLKILAGIYQPTKGTVSIGGKLVPFIELGVGFNPELTGRENVYLNGSLLGFNKKEINDMYDDIVEFAELERFMDQKLKNYSSGMQVRLAFSMAIRADAEILLIDEVLAVGDADFQRKCFRYFKQLKKEKKTVVFVSHDMNAVREYCDRAAFIERSQLVSVDKPEAIAKLYEKLLSPNEKAVSREAKRWGDKTLTIKQPIPVNLTDKIKFGFDVRANKSCDDPVLGFVVRDAAGTSLLGTNTILASNPLGSMNEGDTVAVDWEFLNVLPDGNYSITLAAQYDSGVTNADWWEDALSFRVNRSARTPYIIDPAIEAKINKR